MNSRTFQLLLLASSLVTGLVIFGCSKSVLIPEGTPALQSEQSPSNNGSVADSPTSAPMSLKLENRESLELIFPSDTDKYNRAETLDPYARQDIGTLGARLQMHPVEGVDTPTQRVVDGALELIHAKDGKLLLSRTFAPSQDAPFAKIFSQGAEDLMETMSLVSDGLTLKISAMKRSASSTQDEAMRNAWKGVLSAIAGNGQESRIGEIEGFEYVPSSK